MIKTALMALHYIIMAGEGYLAKMQINNPVSEENLSARPMCPGGHIFLGNFVLPDRIYCPF